MAEATMAALSHWPVPSPPRDQERVQAQQGQDARGHAVQAGRDCCREPVGKDAQVPRVLSVRSAAPQQEPAQDEQPEHADDDPVLHHLAQWWSAAAWAQPPASGKYSRYSAQRCAV
jgi:hypothetical protein